MKRLITERDVQRLPAGGKLAIDRDTIVTPAARDLCFARGIVIADASAPGSGGPDPSGKAAGTTRCGCASCKSGAPCSCSGPWPKLADGDYLLEVRDGQVRARRIER